MFTFTAPFPFGTGLQSNPFAPYFTSAPGTQFPIAAGTAFPSAFGSVFPSAFGSGFPNALGASTCSSAQSGWNYGLPCAQTVSTPWINSYQPTNFIPTLQNGQSLVNTPYSYPLTAHPISAPINTPWISQIGAGQVPFVQGQQVPQAFLPQNGILPTGLGILPQLGQPAVLPFGSFSAPLGTNYAPLGFANAPYGFPYGNVAASARLSDPRFTDQRAFHATPVQPAAVFAPSLCQGNSCQVGIPATGIGALDARSAVPYGYPLISSAIPANQTMGFPVSAESVLQAQQLAGMQYAVAQGGAIPFPYLAQLQQIPNQFGTVQPTFIGSVQPQTVPVVH